ncbi:MAG: hypothetical protein JNJ81_11185 [Candidatus Accumulibacter sp.]|nr:hypothetical protein [Accumulibacter sp.]
MPDTLIHAVVAKHVRGSPRYKARLGSDLVEAKHDMLIKAAIGPLLASMRAELIEHEARTARPTPPRILAVTAKTTRKT